MALDYRTDKDLVTMSIDWILDLFDQRRKSNSHLLPSDVCRLLVRANLFGVLAELIPNLIRFADN